MILKNTPAGIRMIRAGVFFRGAENAEITFCKLLSFGQEAGIYCQYKGCNADTGKIMYKSGIKCLCFLYGNDKISLLYDV